MPFTPRPFRLRSRTVRNINRYRQILTVLVKYGFADFVHRLRIGEYFDFARKLLGTPPKPHLEQSQTSAYRMRLAIQELGPTFIKLGQMLSTRPDILPASFIAEFSLLREHVPPFPLDKAREILTRELGRPIEEIFAYFEEPCVAAASIAQVHRARLRTGEEVAVKIRRPAIRQIIEDDMEVLRHLAQLVEHRYPEWAVQRPMLIVEDFARGLEQELDFTREAAHIDRFRHAFRDDPAVHAPYVYRSLTTERVLTMEYLHVTSLDDRLRLRAAGYDPELIAQRGAELTLKQIFVHGFFHADPHPGNLFVLPGNVVCLLDFGLVGRLAPAARAHFAELIQAMAERDPDRTTRAVLRLTEHEEIEHLEQEMRHLEVDVAEFIDRHLVHALDELNFSQLLSEMLSLANRHRLRIPADLVRMLKAAATVESVAAELDPTLNMVALAEPYIRQAKMEGLRPRRALRRARDMIVDMVEVARDVPNTLRIVFRQVRRGGFNIGFEHHGLQPLMDTSERIANRVSFSIVVASLIVASSLIVHSKLPPVWNGVPVIGMAGYVIAGIMGLILLVAILRHGGL